MKPFNTSEIIGITLSIIIMSLVLSIMTGRIPYNKASQNTQQDSAETVDDETSNSNKEKEAVNALEQTLRDAHSASGELVKLVISDTRLGTEGDPVKNGDTVVVNYVGTLQDGTKFDSSYDRGQTFTFTIGKGIVIKGWEEGLIGMRVGGRRILVIPSDMAYGNKQVGTIPPNTPLIFAVELLEIKK